VLPLAFCLLLVAALLGIALTAMHVRAGTAAPPQWSLGGAHGALALAGYLVLLLSLSGPPRGEALGTASFGRIAAILLAIALLLGLIILVLRLGRWRVTALIGVHATMAISGIVILAAYTFVG